MRPGMDEGVTPRDNMFTRTAALALSQAMQNADPGERQSRYEEALQAAMDGIANDPNNPQSYRQAGEAFVGLNDLAGEAGAGGVRGAHDLRRRPRPPTPGPPRWTLNHGW